MKKVFHRTLICVREKSVYLAFITLSKSLCKSSNYMKFKMFKTNIISNNVMVSEMKAGCDKVKRTFMDLSAVKSYIFT